MSVAYEAILAEIQHDPRYRQNLAWGEPRPGHPERAIQSHIEELERNLAVLHSRLAEDEAGRIRLLIHTHDTFKPDAARGVAISHPQSHASLARAFLAEFLADDDLLAMVQHHDEPYALWKQARNGQLNAQRLEALLSAVQDWNTFLAFQMIDNCTPGKDHEPIRWFFSQLAGRIDSRFTAADIARLGCEPTDGL